MSPNLSVKVSWISILEGYMIRDIIERSGGAQIKIMSDKQSERDAR